MRERLRTPATADFPADTVQSVAPQGSGRFRLAYHVDAQNAFGAMVRTDFTCEVGGDGPHRPAGASSPSR